MSDKKSDDSFDLKEKKDIEEGMKLLDAERDRQAILEREKQERMA